MDDGESEADDPLLGLPDGDWDSSRSPIAVTEEFSAHSGIGAIGHWTWALALSLTSWFLRMPVSEAAAQPDASVLWIGIEAFLVMTFLWGIESLAVAMLPMRFLDGPKVKAWNRPVWAALIFAGVFATVHVLLTPTAGYMGQTTEEVTWDVLIVFAIFGAFSLAVWAYFRYRPARWNSGSGVHPSR